MIQKNLIHKKWDQIKIISNMALLKKKKNRERKSFATIFLRDWKRKVKGIIRKWDIRDRLERYVPLEKTRVWPLSWSRFPTS
jgi:hypothetical protein